ncbi:hypothetical protein SEVIR_7G216833v4 [Setaria viridis]
MARLAQPRTTERLTVVAPVAALGAQDFELVLLPAAVPIVMSPRGKTDDGRPSRASSSRAPDMSRRRRRRRRLGPRCFKTRGPCWLLARSSIARAGDRVAVGAGTAGHILGSRVRWRSSCGDVCWVGAATDPVASLGDMCRSSLPRLDRNRERASHGAHKSLSPEISFTLLDSLELPES